MKICILKSSLALLSVALTTSCVSIDISESDVKRAQGVSFNAPPSPFEEIKTDDVDKAWRNSNGNTITFVTDCGNPYDPTLEAIESGVISGLQSLSKVSTKEKIYNKRASRQSLFIGSVDGIPSKVNLMVFKKNNCIYVLSYLALVKNYDQDEKIFSGFLREFQAP